MSSNLQNMVNKAKKRFKMLTGSRAGQPCPLSCSFTTTCTRHIVTEKKIPQNYCYLNYLYLPESNTHNHYIYTLVYVNRISALNSTNDSSATSRMSIVRCHFRGYTIHLGGEPCMVTNKKTMRYTRTYISTFALEASSSQTKSRSAIGPHID